MKKRIVGRSDLQSSEIGFGCMSLDLSQPGNDRIIAEAFDNGIIYFDTADLYQFGENEKFLGKALQPIRKEVVIATKAGNQWNNSQTSWTWNASKSYLIEAAHNSLRRLKTDYIDLFQLHGGTIEDDFTEVIEAFEQLQKEGKIRHYGFSSIRPNVIRRIAEHGGASSNMMQYSLLDRRPEEEALEVLNDASVSVMARGVLAKGLLAGKEPEGYLDYKKEEVSSLLRHVGEQGEIHPVAMAYALHTEAVGSLVIGIRTNDQLRLALEAYAKSKELSELDWPSLLEPFPPHQYKDHR
jgi:aryl-alcohol dehydrogenase-like predicted oxidoreductase